MQERAVRVFVSSTFRDMFLDREVLVKQVFPEISTFCLQRGVEFTGIDLRTGVTAEQSEEGLTLNLCLREVERCRPYFLCMLGERYGWCQGSDSGDTLLKKTFENTISQHPEFSWIANYSSSSVTELEIRQGYLNDPKNCKHALFLFRNSDYVYDLLNEGLITSDDMNSFLAESEDAKTHLLDLKKEISTSGAPVIEYNHHADIHQCVIQYLKRAITEDFPEQDIVVGPLDLERREHQTFAESRCRVYVGRQHYYDALNRYVSLEPPPCNNDDSRDDMQNSIFFVHGASGCGKSSLLANWAQLLHSNESLAVKVCFTHLHFVGSSSSSSDPTKMLHRLLHELKSKFLSSNSVGDNGGDSLPSNWEQLLLLMPEVLQEVSVHLCRANRDRGSNTSPQVVVIIIDALNQLSEQDEDGAIDSSTGKSEVQSAFAWLPQYLPPFIRMVVSAIDLPPEEEFDMSLHVPALNQLNSQEQAFVLAGNTLEVLPLDEEGVKGIATTYMSGYGKTLAENQVKMLMACERTKNPLFLRSVLEEVRMWGKYELLTQQIASYLQKETIGDLFDAILSRLESDFCTVQYSIPTLSKMPCVHCGGHTQG